MLDELFGISVDEGLADPEYIAIRDSPTWSDIRESLAKQWSRFKFLADPHFIDEFWRKGCFNSRVWEMRLGCALLEAGHGALIQSRSSGPDFCVGKVAIEAVAPKPCASIIELGSTLRRKGEVTAPEAPIILRFTSAIMDKRKQYARWVESGLIAPGHPFVIAVSGTKFGPRILDSAYPLILWPLFGVNQEKVTLDSSGPTRLAFEFSESRAKSEGVTVNNFLFRPGGATEVSAVVFSDRHFRTGLGRFDDFVTIHNPAASAPLPERFLPYGREFALRGASVVQTYG